MKKQILLLTLLIASIVTNAQLKPSFGVRAGVLSSSMKGDAFKSLNGILDFTNGIVTTKDHTGYFAGINANIPFTDVLSLEPGLNYAEKGYQLYGSYDVKNLEFLSAEAKSDLRLKYLDIPMLLKANISGLQIFAGPQLSYLLNADLKTTAGALGFNLLNNTTDATQQFNKWDGAITGGLGYQFTNGLNIQASYDHGLSKVDANKSFDAYNRVFKIGVGMKF